MLAAFRALVLSDTAVAALIGTRMQPVRLDAGTALPALVYQDISLSEEHSHDGFAGLARTRIQVGSVADTFEQAKALDRAVCAAIDGVSATQDDVQMSITVENRISLATRASDAASNTWTVLTDFFVWYRFVQGD